jgi:hypothetical protein
VIPVWFTKAMPKEGDPNVGSSKGQATAVRAGDEPVGSTASWTLSVLANRAATQLLQIRAMLEAAQY